VPLHKEEIATKHAKWSTTLMTQTALRLKTRTLAGKRLEVTIPELNEGEEVEIIVLRTQEDSLSLSKPNTLSNFLQTIAPGPRPFQTWEEYERALKQEKEEWEH
jgi:hypothetical protein